MAERLYTLDEVNNFLKEQYNLEWRDFQIIRQGLTLAIRPHDFNRSCLRVPAVLYQGKSREIRWLCISNRYFSVYGENNKGKTKLWQTILAGRNNQEQNQNNIL